MTASPPLVSCILATGDRPRFVRQAIRCFLRRTYANAELIVVDGGREPVAELCAGLAAVRYLRAEPSTSLGARLNLGAAHAAGEILQKLDDDDYYDAGFLERAVAERRDDAVVAWDCFFVLLEGDDELRFSRHGWTAGGTLSFPRRVWERTPFRDAPSSVDAYFLADSGAAVRRVCAPRMYVLVRHGANTWRSLRGTNVDNYFRALPKSGVKTADLVEPIDRPFYAALAREGA